MRSIAITYIRLFSLQLFVEENETNTKNPKQIKEVMKSIMDIAIFPFYFLFSIEETLSKPFRTI